MGRTVFVSNVNTLKLSVFKKPSLVSEYKLLNKLAADLTAMELQIENNKFTFNRQTYDRMMISLESLKRMNSTTEYELFRQLCLSTLRLTARTYFAYLGLKSLKSPLENVITIQDVLINIKMLQEYVLRLKSSLFPPLLIKPVAAIISPDIAMYLQLYGKPTGGNFDPDLLASIRATLNGDNDTSADPPTSIDPEQGSEGTVNPV